MWGLLLALIPSLIQMLSGDGDKTGTTTAQDQTTTTTATPTGYQSPTLGLLDLLMQGTLGQNLKTYSNWGLPKGQSIAPDYLQDFLGLIGSEYTNLQQKYTNPAPIIPVETVATCRTKCEKDYPVWNDRKAKCLSDCQWKYSGKGA